MQFENKIGEKIIYTNGSFSRKIIWFRGCNKDLAQEYRKNKAIVKFINGLGGKEIEVRVDESRTTAFQPWFQDYSLRGL